MSFDPIQSTTISYGSYALLNDNTVKKIKHSSKLKPSLAPLTFNDPSLPINTIDLQNLDQRMKLLNIELHETLHDVHLTIQHELRELKRLKGLTQKVKKTDYTLNRNHSLTWPQRSHRIKVKLYDQTIVLFEEMLAMTSSTPPTSMNHVIASKFIKQLLALSQDQIYTHPILYESIMSVIFEFSTLTRIIDVIAEQQKLLSISLDSAFLNTPVNDIAPQSMPAPQQKKSFEIVQPIQSFKKKVPFFKKFKETFRIDSRASSSSDSIDSFQMIEPQTGITVPGEELVLCRLCEERIHHHTFQKHIQICTIEKTGAVEIYALNTKLEKYLKLIRNFDGSVSALELVRKIEKRVEKVLQWSSRKIDLHRFGCQLRKLEILCVDALGHSLKLFSVDQMSLLNAILSKSREKMEKMKYLKSKLDEFYTERFGSRDSSAATRPQIGNSSRSSMQSVSTSSMSSRPKGFLSVLSAILKTQSTSKISLESKSHVPSISDFQIISPINSGGYGKVYLAKKTTTQDIFAIKILKKEDMIRKNMISSVLTERKAQSLSQTRYIVPLFYAFQNQSSLFLVMEFMVGGDLGGLLFEFGVFDRDMVLFYSAEMTLAIAYLHENGIVHRDIKPDNVLIASDGHCKLTDFGLSKIDIKSERLNSIRRDYTIRKPIEVVKCERVVGTPDYLAPELLLGIEHTHAVDWWALGCCIYEFTLGHPPFAADTPELIFREILANSVCYPSDMEEDVIELVKSLLIADPIMRGNAKSIKSSDFFGDIEWDSVYQSQPPFIPKPLEVVNQIDEPEFQLSRQSTIESMFQEFNYVNIDVLKDRR